MVKRVLVVHPRFNLYGGGELLCLHTIKSLQDKGYSVQLATGTFSMVQSERMFGPIGQCLRNVEHLPIPGFKRILPRFMAYQHIRYAGKIQLLFGHPELVVSTQSSLYYVPGVDTYHFIYDMVDLSVVKFSHHIAGSLWKLPYYMILRRYRRFLEKPEPTRHFLALSRNISRDLDSVGYKNSFIIPPCPVDYGPLPKKKRVIVVTRIVPQKRLEEFMEIARRLPQYEFRIMGLTNEPFRRYRDKLLANLPHNVGYDERPLRSMPSLLQESKVYLYTSREPGLPIAVVQGIGAGCFPIVPDTGGGPEAVEIAGIGWKYRSVNEAVEQIEVAMSYDVGSGEYVAMAADKFSPEKFRERVQEIVQ